MAASDVFTGEETVSSAAHGAASIVIAAQASAGFLHSFFKGHRLFYAFKVKLADMSRTLYDLNPAGLCTVIG